jgi:hypothetical protein
VIDVAANQLPAPVAPTLACADAGRRAGEDLAGSAPKAASWLLLEQPGPWGGKAATESDLDPALGAALEAAGEQHGFRLGLLRRNARRERDTRARTCFLVSTRRSGPWIERHVLSDPSDALALDLAALGAGCATSPGCAWPHPVFAVCTHGKRDPCCARLGRPLARALTARHRELTWQCSHIGGHRFAPAFVAFPTGLCFGRVPAAAGPRIAAELLAGRIALPYLRGRSGDSPLQQAADVLVRRRLDLREIDDLVPEVAESEPGGRAGRVVLARPDGGRLRAHVAWRQTGIERPTSCGSELEDPGQLELVALETLA